MKTQQLTIYQRVIIGSLLWLPVCVLAAIPVVENSESSVTESVEVNSPGATSNQQSGPSDPFAAFPEVPALPVDATPEEELLFLVNQLTQEVQLLRGIVEEQRNEIVKIKQIQRERYIDLDRRLTELYRAPNANSLATNQSPQTGNGNNAESGLNQSSDRQEISTYEQAVGLIRTRSYAQAVEALKKYIDVYPKGQYVPNAFYWLGQVYTVQEKPDYNQARVALSQVIEKYPDHPKVPDARYKLGVVFDQLGDKAKARQLLQSVIQNNPGSSAARLADTYLRGIQ